MDAIYVITRGDEISYHNYRDSRKIRAYNSEARAKAYIKTGEKVIKFIPINE